jgi:hypothetical protein
MLAQSTSDLRDLAVAITAVAGRRPLDVVDSASVVMITGWSGSEFEYFRTLMRKTAPVSVSYEAPDCAPIDQDPPCVVFGVYEWRRLGNAHFELFANWRARGICGGYSARFVVDASTTVATIRRETPFAISPCRSPSLREND